MVAVCWNYDEAESYVSQVAFSWYTEAAELAIQLSPLHLPSAGRT